MPPREVALLAFASDEKGEVVFTNEAVLVMRHGIQQARSVQRFDYHSTSLSPL